MVGAESTSGAGPIDFIERSYALAEQITRDKEFVVIRFEPEHEAGAGPVFGCRVLSPAASSA